MNLFRLLTILILLPVTVLSGMPYVGCRCSNGEVHLSCPKLRAKQSQKASDSTVCCVTQTPSTENSCCAGNQSTSCCKSKGKTVPGEGESCCADGCRCTPVLITAEVGPKLAKVSVPDLVHNGLANLSAVTGILVIVSRVDGRCIESKPDLPIDLIVLFERFLV